MAQGFRLVGRGTQSGVFKPETKHALMTEEGLLMKARFLRPLILGRINSSEPFDYVDELHDTTESEARDKRWLEGPFPPNKLERGQAEEQVAAHWQLCAEQGERCLGMP